MDLGYFVSRDVVASRQFLQLLEHSLRPVLLPGPGVGVPQPGKTQDLPSPAGLLEFSDGLLTLAALYQRAPQVKAGEHVSRIEFQRFTALGGGCLVAAREVECSSQCRFH